MENREFERQSGDFDMRIYTSVKKGAYSVKASDIGVGGAFIKSTHMPKIGEIISFEFYNSMYKPIHMGNAKVCRIKSNTVKREKGFAIMFYEKISSSLIEEISI